jgi:hypothetical protein
MSFTTGKFHFDIVGNDKYLSYFKNIFSLIETDKSPDIVFEFVKTLPPLNDSLTVKLDDFTIAENSITHREKLFDYRIDWSSTQTKVFVSPRKFDFFRKTQKTLNKNWRYFHTHGTSGFLHFFKRFVFYVYVPAMQLYLLNNGSSFAHCSAIQKNGEATVFPAWGGIGKTGLMSIFLSQGWQFLSDDLGILDHDGSINLHPLPMHIYKYHQIQSPELVENMLKRLSPLDRMTWNILNPIKKANKLVRWVKPDVVFGKETICKKSKITRVIHMHRHMINSQFIFEESSNHDVAALMASTILDEINNIANYSIVYNSVRESDYIPNISKLHKIITNNYTQAMKNAKCYKLSIPEASTTSDAFNFLKEKGVL